MVSKRKKDMAKQVIDCRLFTKLCGQSIEDYIVCMSLGSDRLLRSAGLKCEI